MTRRLDSRVAGEVTTTTSDGTVCFRAEETACSSQASTWFKRGTIIDASGMRDSRGLDFGRRNSYHNIGSKRVRNSHDFASVQTWNRMAFPAPEVSVIIPVFNGESTIRRCVESVLASQYPAGKMEVICVDNSSTDGTLRILESFGPVIQIFQESKRGAGAARNTGLRRASGEFVVFTDADCTVAPDWLAKLIEPVRTGQASAAGGRILARPEAGPVERFGELIHDHRKAIEDDLPPYIISMNMAARRDLLLAVGGFDERWIRMQDVDISFRLVARGERFAYCHDAIVYHHNRDTIPTLMREAFIHGYYGAAFSRTYHNFVRAYRRKAALSSQGKRSTAELPNPRLKPWQIGLLWKLFNGTKKLGRIKGRLFPPVVIE